jgi:hypothetical protein
MRLVLEGAGGSIGIETIRQLWRTWLVSRGVGLASASRDALSFL